MICHKHHAILVHIQKTGGTAVSLALGMSANEPDKHFLGAELKRACEPDVWRRYFKFSIVRNPWARLVSWYAMIDSHRAAFEAGAPLNPFQATALLRTSNFRDFLVNMDEEIADSDGRKWIYRNQVDYLVDESGALLVDHIARTETLAADWAAMRPRFAAVTPIALPVVNQSRHGAYVDYYTPELAEMVAQRYRADIERFGFRFGD